MSFTGGTTAHRARSDAERAQRTLGLFSRAFRAEADGVAMAPGRVNLIGEHTDYNQGFVLPMAIDRATTIAFRRRTDEVVRVHATFRGDTREFRLFGLHPRGVKGWPAYIAGIAWAMARSGMSPCGLDLLVDSDVPSGAGLSSSAALEVATHLAFCTAIASEWEPVASAQLAQHAENDFVGVACGIMDQLCVAASHAGSALLIDCRSLTLEPVPIPGNMSVVVIDTTVHRTLASSAYNDRRGACERVVARLQATDPTIRALRDIGMDRLDAHRAEIGSTDYRRAAHVIAENDRVIAAVRAMRAGDGVGVGSLWNASHESLRTLYEVSGPELDAVVEIARDHPACFGARLTGAGFGGCAIALVDTARVEDFVRETGATLARQLPSCGEPFVAQPSMGARLIG